MLNLLIVNVSTLHLNSNSKNKHSDGLAKALHGFDGETLETLIESMDRSPEFFFKSVKEDLQLSFINCLKFVRKLRQLQYE